MDTGDIFCVAWELHNASFHVIPSGGGQTGKHPLIEWAPYQKRRPTDEEMHAWVDEFRPELWGIVTGAACGLVVVDADSQEQRASMEKSLGPPHVVTPRGGGHWYFKHPGQSVKTRAGLLPGLDVRGDGGFVNVVGHNHAGDYQILCMPAARNLHSWDKLPPEIAEAMSAYHPTPKGDAPAAVIPNGQRNSILTSYAGSMRRRGMGEAAIAAALLETNAAQCQPPLPESEVRAITASVVRYPPTNGPVTQTNNVTTGGGAGRTNSGKHPESPNNRYKNVTGSCGNGVVTDSVTPPETLQSDEGLPLQILEWVKGTSAWWATQELDSDLGIKDASAKNYRRLILHRLKEQGIIEQHPRVNKHWRYVDKRLTRLDFRNPAGAGALPVKWPLGIEKYVHLYAGTMAVVAGSPNAGKTALLLNFIRMNMDRFPIAYFSSEPIGNELHNRLLMFPDIAIDDWRFDAYERYQDFHDVVIPDLVNIIDFLEVSADFYGVNELLTAINRRVGSGLAIVAIQKAVGAPLGRGKEFSMEKPRLYLSMDRNKVTIQKGKNWANRNVDPHGLSVGFKITDGCNFEITRDWGKW